jgi:hypothetical protein
VLKSWNKHWEFGYKCLGFFICFHNLDNLHYP